MKNCTRCGGILIKGMALLPMPKPLDGGSAQDIKRGQAYSFKGQPALVKCLKCKRCGQSYTKESVYYE